MAFVKLKPPEVPVRKRQVVVIAQFKEGRSTLVQEYARASGIAE